MKVSYNGSNPVHKDVYRNLIYTGNSKYSFNGENGFDNAVGRCTNAPNFTPFGPTPPGPTPPAYWGLCFTAEEAGSTVSMTKIDGAPEVHLQTSTDGETWTPFIVDETTITLTNVGDKVYFAATDEGNNSFGAFEGCDTFYNKFIMTGKISASGDISSLLDNKNSVTDLTERYYCFYSLFNDCTSLTSVPQLPATTLASFCYAGMFSGCSSITTASELPATTLSMSCYSEMFKRCSSLTTTPNLPATTLALGCYSYMFSNCSSLTTAPELPATTLANSCYETMFYGCSSLNSIEVKCTSWIPVSFSYWVEGVASTGTFKCPTALGTNETITRGDSNCPTNWTVENID